MASFLRGDSDASAASSSRSDAIDEAYRRVGHRLSQRVGGDDSSTVATLDSLGDNPQSAFHLPLTDVTIPSHAELGYDRTAKVAKKGYSDHGRHAKRVTGRSVLKNLTFHAKDTYSALIQQQKQSPPVAGKKRISPTDSLSPHRQALDALEIEDTKATSEPKGLLQAALDGGKVTDVGKVVADGANGGSHSSSSTERIGNSAAPERGKCLTQPPEPVSNNGLDNADGNLIVNENDQISVPTKQVHTLLHARNKFRVISLLGQGTFAQVFKCQCLKTGDIVAVKVVKNKPAYTRQAAVEIDVFTALSDVQKENMVRLQCYFMYQHHLCLVFELLGANLYEVLKKRQFRGLPLPIVRSLLRQVVDGVKDLSQKNIVHCDLKPENILLSNEDDVESLVHGEMERQNSLATSTSNEALSSFGGTPTTEPSTDDTGRTSSEASSQLESPAHKVKLIDFGSACFEGHAAHTYIQSRFYRSPEVIIGLPYDSAIDMWSMGCVAAELFLGLPILPGVHEHDQLGRISEMIGPLPERMMEQGSKSSKFFVKQFSKQAETLPKTSTDLPPRTPSPGTGSPAPPKAIWRLKSRQEYIQSLSASEVRKKGGMAKLQKQQTNRYFKRKKLADIIMLHGHCTSSEERESVGLFAHFLMGILDPDPLKRWTAYQASMHPFITGREHRRRATTCDSSSREFDICWTPPWDPTVCQRKLLEVQRTREKQRALRRSVSGGAPPRSVSGGYDGRSLDAAIDELSPLRRSQQPASPATRRTGDASPTVDTLSFNRQGIPQTLSNSQGLQISPPSSIGTSMSYQAYAQQPGSLGSLNVHDSRIMGNVPYPMYGGPASFSDYNSGVAVDQRIAISSVMNSSYGDGPMGFTGSQSFSAIHGESLNQMPVEADFGYALQRPGVFPGMDLSGASNLQPPQVKGPLCSPRQMQTSSNHQRSKSFSHSSAVGGSSAPQRRTSHGHIETTPRSPANQAHSQYMLSQTMASATSIREDSSDYVLGGSMESSSVPVRSSAASSATSLLSAQMRSAGANGDSYQERMHASDSRMLANSSSQPPAYLGQVPASTAPQGQVFAPGITSSAPGMSYAPNLVMPSTADATGYYYTTYITPNGAVMSAPVNMTDMQSAAAMQMYSYGSSGSYADQSTQLPYGPPGTLHPQMYPPAHISQRSFEDNNQTGSAQRPHAPPPQYYHHHNGMSM